MCPAWARIYGVEVHEKSTVGMVSESATKKRGRMSCPMALAICGSDMS